MEALTYISNKAVIACLWLMMGWIGAQLLDFARLALQHALQG